MVNGEQILGVNPFGGHPERALALSYAPPATRARVEALFALDATLGAIVRRAREPVVAQLRLAWWDEALRALDTGSVAAHPVLAALADGGRPAPLQGAALARIIDGWEVLLDEEVADDALRRFGEARGGTLFAAAAELVAASDGGTARTGEGWALADLATHLSDPALAARAARLAGAALAEQTGRRWPRPLRFLGALARSAQFDLDRASLPGSPGRVARILRLRLFGQ